MEYSIIQILVFILLLPQVLWYPQLKNEKKQEYLSFYFKTEYDMTRFLKQFKHRRLHRSNHSHRRHHQTTTNLACPLDRCLCSYPFFVFCSFFHSFVIVADHHRRRELTFDSPCSEIALDCAGLLTKTKLFFQRELELAEKWERM